MITKNKNHMKLGSMLLALIVSSATYAYVSYTHQELYCESYHFTYNDDGFSATLDSEGKLEEEIYRGSGSEYGGIVCHGGVVSKSDQDFDTRNSQGVGTYGTRCFSLEREGEV